MNPMLSATAPGPVDFVGPGARKAYDLVGPAVLGESGALPLLASCRHRGAEDPLNRRLHDFYETMLREPVPARLLALVEALEAQRPD
jgi:hypothetical protein